MGLDQTPLNSAGGWVPRLCFQAAHTQAQATLQSSLHGRPSKGRTAEAWALGQQGDQKDKKCPPMSLQRRRQGEPLRSNDVKTVSRRKGFEGGQDRAETKNQTSEGKENTTEGFIKKLDCGLSMVACTYSPNVRDSALGR